MKHLLGIICVLTFGVIASAQPAAPPRKVPATDNKTDLFRGLLQFRGLQTSAKIPGDLSDYVVIVYGTAKGTEDILRQAFADGASILVATDSYLDLGSLLPGRQEVVIDGGRVSSDFAGGLAGKSDFPLITIPPLEGMPAGSPFTIATESPSAIRFNWQLGGFSIPFLPSHKFEQRPLARNEVFAIYGFGNSAKQQRCLVLADQDVFNNRMLYASASSYGGLTPDNFRFADEVIKWLTLNGQRKKCIYIENGTSLDPLNGFDFTAIPPTNLPPDVPMPPVPNPLDRPIQEGLAKTIDNGLARVEDDNLLNRAFTRDNRVYGWLLAGILSFALSIFLTLFIRRVWQARHRASFQPLPADPLMLGGDAPLGSFEHRRLELLRGGDFRAPVVAYLRRLFEERGLDVETAGRVPPPLDIRGRNHRELKSMIRELWDEAFVFDREPLPYTRWKEIEQSLAAVRTAADAGQWQFRSGNAG